MAGFERVEQDARRACEAESFCAAERFGNDLPDAWRIMSRTVTLCQYISVGYHSNTCGFRFERLTGIVDAGRFRLPRRLN